MSIVNFSSVTQPYFTTSSADNTIPFGSGSYLYSQPATIMLDPKLIKEIEFLRKEVSEIKRRMTNSVARTVISSVPLTLDPEEPRKKFLETVVYEETVRNKIVYKGIDVIPNTRPTPVILEEIVWDVTNESLSSCVERAKSRLKEASFEPNTIKFGGSGAIGWLSLLNKEPGHSIDTVQGLQVYFRCKSNNALEVSSGIFDPKDFSSSPTALVNIVLMPSPSKA